MISQEKILIILGKDFFELCANSAGLMAACSPKMLFR